MSGTTLLLPIIRSDENTSTQETKSILKKDHATVKKKAVMVDLDTDSDESVEISPTGKERRARFEDSDTDVVQEKEELTTQQIEAFRQVFDMLDKDGGGSIDAEELYNSMKDLDVNLTQHEITEILKELDNDGNGEIDFEEFLFMMTNMSIQIKEAQQGELKVENPRLWKRQSIFFSVITKFAIQHSLCEIESHHHEERDIDSIKAIQRNFKNDLLLLGMKLGQWIRVKLLVVPSYYASKARQVPHVVGYYAAGARVDGLSDKQLQRTWKNLTREMKDEKSPYAKPLNFIIPVPYGTNSRIPKKKTIRPKRKPATNVSSTHSLSTMSTTSPTTTSTSPLMANSPNRGKMNTTKKSSECTIDNHSNRNSGRRPGSKKGWTPIYHLPIHKIQFPVVGVRKKNQNLTIEHLPRIRKKVDSARAQYSDRLNDVNRDMAKHYWDSLHVDEIPSARLQENFMRVFRAYSPKCEFEAAYSLRNDERYDNLQVAIC